MPEQVLIQSDGNYKQSMMFQFHPHCVDGKADLSTAFGSTRERKKHPEVNKMPNLRVVRSVASDSVQSIADERRNTCCQSEARRQGAVVNSGLNPIRLRGAQAVLNDARTTTANRRLNIHVNATSCAVYLFGSCASSHESLSFPGSVEAYVLSPISSLSYDRS